MFMKHVKTALPKHGSVFIYHCYKDCKCL